MDPRKRRTRSRPKPRYILIPLIALLVVLLVVLGLVWARDLIDLTTN
jgi:hypothetical protein